MGDLLGAGGMGAVFRAERIALNEPVAIKFLHPKLALDKDAIARFIREAQATSRIKNEHVVRILDVGSTENGLPFLVMDLLEGRDLGDVAEQGPLSITDAVDFVLQAAEALAEAHALGIVHRDIKPANLWLGRRSDGSPLVKVLDFGISKLAPTAGGDSKLTETSAVFGSPTYMSPEQIRSSKKVDARTDVWSLAVVLYELLTGRQPFEAETSGGVLASISADPPIPFLPRRPDSPPALDRAILACLEKDVSRRASLAALATMLMPMASPAGVLSAERVIRTGQPGLPFQDGSIQVPAASSAQALEAFARTEPLLSEEAGGAGGRRSARAVWGVALGVGIALGVVGLGSALLLTRTARVERTTSAPSVDVTQVASSPLTGSVAVAAPTTTTAVAAASIVLPSGGAASAIKVSATTPAAPAFATRAGKPTPAASTNGAAVKPVPTAEASAASTSVPSASTATSGMATGRR